MTVAKIKRQVANPQLVADTAARVHRLERQNEMILADLADRSSNTVWLILIAAYFVMGMWAGFELTRKEKRRRE
jgi:hypothetical protein